MNTGLFSYSPNINQVYWTLLMIIRFRYGFLMMLKNCSKYHLFSSISKWVTGSNHHARHEPIIWKANNGESDRLEKLDSISDQGLNRLGKKEDENEKMNKIN